MGPQSVICLTTIAIRSIACWSRRHGTNRFSL